MKKKLRILYEDKYLLAVYKKSGLPTIKDKKHVNSLYSEVYDYLHKKNQRVFVVHRLDADTSGIVLFAKNETVKNNLQDNWGSVIREYIALVHFKSNEEGVIKSYLKETKTLYTYSSDDKKNGKYAETHYKRIKYNKIYSLLKIDIKTGRKNQIRVHMKDNNTPIVGDKKYGIKDGYRNMMLLASRLFFVHPITRERINIELDIPNEYLKVFE
ncbi:MAG: RluA family pseudouridine synthase [Bacilli bacterium]|nr:RluA family pseudouridine synthase [Bacilli bacterium]